MSTKDDVYRVFDGGKLLLESKGSLPNLIQVNKGLNSVSAGDYYLHNNKKRLIVRVDSVSSDGNKTRGFNIYLENEE